MISVKKKLLLSAVGAAALMGSAVPSHAANWLMLQGTEKPFQASRAYVWGFVQPEYTFTDDSKLGGGPWKGQSGVFNQMRPDLKSPDGFNVLRARIGVRGTGFPLDENVNYFVLAEMGNNGITRQGGGSIKLTDASVTLNHVKGARVRVGQFKTPGSEEGLQAIHVFDYINFTGGVNGLLLERFFDTDGSNTGVIPGSGGPPTVLSGTNPNRPNGPVSAFRDVGIQVFDSFVSGGWDHSYAVMVGNGNGITRGDNDDNYETYLYWSSEKLFDGQVHIFGGRAARRQGWKMYAWFQDGKRTILKERADTMGEFDRERWGLGTAFRKGKWRAAAEYFEADGMIFTGTDGAATPGSVSNPVGPGGVFGTAVASFNMETEGEADAWYIHGGYALTPKWELDLRYDRYNRMTDVAAKEREFDTWTAGVQYFFNKKSRFLLNYEFREGEAPNEPGSSNANKVLDSLDDRISAQLLIIF